MVDSEPEFVNVKGTPGICSKGVPARQATFLAGGIDSLESIPGLLKRLKIRSLLSIHQAGKTQVYHLRSPVCIIICNLEGFIRLHGQNRRLLHLFFSMAITRNTYNGDREKSSVQSHMYEQHLELCIE